MTIGSRLSRAGLAGFGALALSLASGGAVLAQDVAGTWLRESGASRVRFAKCGEAMCGTLAWLKDTNGPAKVGQRIFYDMKPSGDGKWSGSAFNGHDDAGRRQTDHLGLRAGRADLPLGDLEPGELKRDLARSATADLSPPRHPMPMLPALHPTKGAVARHRAAGCSGGFRETSPSRATFSEVERQQIP